MVKEDLQMGLLPRLETLIYIKKGRFRKGVKKVISFHFYLTSH